MSIFIALSAPDPEKFFQVLASTQSKRLDDQRVSLPSLPGIKNGSTSSTSTATEKDASFLCYMVSKAQVGPIHNVHLKGHDEKFLTHFFVNIKKF